MLTLLFTTAFADTPFESGPQEPLPEAPNDIAVSNGSLWMVTDENLRMRVAGEWTVMGPGGQALLAQEDRLYVCGPTGLKSVTQSAVVPLDEEPCLDVAATEDSLWLLREDGVFTLEGEPIDMELPDLLGGGPEEVRVIGNRFVYDHGERLVFPGTSALARLPGDRGWALLHPERNLLGLLRDEAMESGWTLPIQATRMAVGDLDDDGSIELIIASADAWLSMEVSRPDPRVRAVPIQPLPPPRPTWQPPETVSVFGFPMPRFAARRPQPRHDSILISGVGLAVGGALGPNQIIGRLSPMGFGGIERGRGRIRSFIGADSAPLIIWGGRTSGLHLAMASAGFTVGSAYLRAGPFVSGGLLGAGAGVRGVFTPVESRNGKLSGLEARLTWLAPGAAHGSLSWVTAAPLGRRNSKIDLDKPAVSVCHRFGLAAGAAAGISSTENAWEFIGNPAAYQISASPALSLSCEVGRPRSSLVIAADTAPWFFYRVSTSAGGADQKLHHLGSLTVGASIGGDHLRFGPIATVGVWTLGAGLRGVLTPIHTKQGVWHGLEVRAVALWPSSPALQGMALWHVWFDPKTTRSP